MYSGSRRILIQVAVSDSVQSTCGLPPGCGLAVDLLHAFLIRTLQSAGRQVEVCKYVDDMILRLLPDLTLRTILGTATRMCSIKAFKQANVQVNPPKMVFICNGMHTEQTQAGLACRSFAPCEDHHQRPWG
eukprot:6347384-Amphidinium_carterae.1